MQSDGQQRADNAVSRALFNEVWAGLDQDSIRAWIRPTHETKRITAINFLVVIFSMMLSYSGDDDEEIEREPDDVSRKIVSDWSSELFEASQMRSTREITPFDSISGIPCQTTSPNWDWSLSIGDADAFLERRGYERFCSRIIAGWYEVFIIRGIRLEPDLASEPIEISSNLPTEIEDIRRKVPGSAWSDEQYLLLQKDFEAAKGGTISDRRKAVGVLWAMSEHNVKKQLATIKNREKTKSPFAGLGVVKSGRW